MAYDFPNSPTVGQQVTSPSTGVVYVWDGVAWRPVSVPLPPYAPVTSPTFSGNPQTPTMPYGDADQSIASTAFVAAAVAPALNNIGRNLIHNPLFNVAQRGAGPWTTAGSYTADRWYISIVNDALSVSLILLADTDRAAISDESASTCLQATFTGSATAGSLSLIQQRTESVRRLSGKAVTLSFWARASTGTPRLGISISQNFGQGGSPSSGVLTPFGATVALGATWVRYTLSGTVPSSAGKTFGTTAGTDFSGVNIYLSDQGNASGGGIGVQSGTIQLWGVQLEIGTVATPLDYGGTTQQQLAQCQRFYQTYPALLASGYINGVSGLYADFIFAVPMRAAPTVAFANIVYTSASTLATNLVNTSHLRVSYATTAAAVANVIFDANLSADL